MAEQISFADLSNESSGLNFNLTPNDEYEVSIGRCTDANIVIPR